MKYGKRLRDEVERNFPEWRAEFISYKQLKKQLNLMRVNIGDILDARSERDDVNLMIINSGFTRLLDEQLHKVTTFYIDKEEDYVIRMKELKDREANLDSIEEMRNLLKDILDFHAEMALFMHYSILNSTGFLKIVKKHKKRIGASIQFPFMPRVLEQPFFSTDLLYNLMQECEAMVRRLFLGGEP